MAQIRREEWPADLVAMTGDLTQDETVESYQRFKKLFSALGLPVYCVPGNHDVRSVMKEELCRPPFYYCESVELQNWLLVGIDSCIEGDAGGRVSDQELDRLQQLLDRTDADHVLICLHHPPLQVGSEWLDGVGLKNGSEFLNALSTSGKTRAAIFGHIHQSFEKQYNGIRIIGTPSSCRQFKAGSEKFALDDNPPAYRRIVLQENGAIETELMWLRGP